LKKAIFIYILCFFSSCVSSILPTKKPKPEEKIESYSEDLSVFLPTYESEKPIESPSEADKKTPSSPAKANVEIKSQSEEVDKIILKLAEYNKKIANGAGYRVQVYIGNNKQEFESAKSFLYQNFSDHEVYESYSQPTYRLKMGDFLNNKEAEVILDEVKSRYSSARLITERINIKKAIDNK
jgi:SPOR domain